MYSICACFSPHQGAKELNAQHPFPPGAVGHGWDQRGHDRPLTVRVGRAGRVARALFCCFLVSGSLPLPGFGALVVASGFLFGFPYGSSLCIQARSSAR